MISQKLSLILGAATAFSNAATITFEPDQLSGFQTNGSLIYHEPDSSIATSNLTLVEPGIFRLETVISTVNHQAIYFHPWIGATFLPASQGPIAGVGFSIELRQPEATPPITPIYLTLAQAGEIYFYTADLLVPRSFRSDEDSLNFILRDQAESITSEDFARFDSGGLASIDSSSHPDFSANGQGIQWGISTLSGTGNVNFQRVIDFRNARLTISTIPEPGNLLTVTFLGFGFLVRHRR